MVLLRACFTSERDNVIDYVWISRVGPAASHSSGGGLPSVLVSFSEREGFSFSPAIYSQIFMQVSTSKTPFFLMSVRMMMNATCSRVHPGSFASRSHDRFELESQLRLVFMST